jgi:hypothetical protein
LPDDGEIVEKSILPANAGAILFASIFAASTSFEKATRRIERKKMKEKKYFNIASLF